jgi:GntR family transcriptional regulator, transcriptional repressor for pyruvate dehydrogenase complex
MNELLTEDLTKPTLTARLMHRLAEEIQAGVLKPGQQLPTGQELSRRFGVSLTVVREALSSLKSDGLIQSRQGSGAFVSASRTARPFRLAHPTSAAPVNAQKLFELRTGVEMQAAVLAAERSTQAQRRAITAAYKAMEADVAAGLDSVSSDVMFHRRIAEASGNELFANFLDFLSDHIRSTIQSSREGDEWPRHRDEVMAEHRALMDAILKGDAAAARLAAQAHMDHCLRRCLPAAARRQR